MIMYYREMWIPMEADCVTERENLTKESYHYKITEFVFNPETIELDSFTPDDIPDGARVRLIDSNDLLLPERYTWNDGKVIDTNGKELSFR